MVIPTFDLGRILNIPNEIRKDAFCGYSCTTNFYCQSTIIPGYNSITINTEYLSGLANQHKESKLQWLKRHEKPIMEWSKTAIENLAMEIWR